MTTSPSSKKKVHKKDTPHGSVKSPPSVSLKLYRNIALSFLLLVILSFIFVVFLSTSKATITIVPEQNTLEAQKKIQMGTSSKETNQDVFIQTKILSQAIDEEKSFSADKESAEEIVGVASGFVTVYNERSKAQPLVATTRLLSSGGVLFRLKQNVFVPAKGQVEVQVYANEQGKEGDIGADTFTIPGLPLLIQKEVYAKSTQPMSGGVLLISTLTQEQLSASETLFEQEIFEQAKEELRQQKGDFDGEFFSIEEEQKQSSALAGEKVSSYTIHMKAQITAFFYKKEDMQKIMETALYEQMENGYKLAKADYDQSLLIIDSVDQSGQWAQAQVQVKGTSIATITHPELDVSLFAGKTREEIRQYLLSHKLAKQVTISFFPPWLRKAPRLKDHIQIVIQEL